MEYAMSKNQENDIVKLVKSNQLAAVKEALEKGANVNSSDNQGKSLLLLATIDKNIEMAKLLVAFNADVNQQDQQLDSSFLYAGASGQTELVKLYLDNGARFDIFNRYKGSALIPACERGHIETVKLLANTPNFPIDHVNRLGWTALMEAIILGNGSHKYQEIVKILIAAGVNKNIPDKDGVTPIEHAKRKGFSEIVDLLN